MQGLQKSTRRGWGADVSDRDDRWIQAGGGKRRQQRGPARAHVANQRDDTRGLGRKEIEKPADFAFAVQHGNVRRGDGRKASSGRRLLRWLGYGRRLFQARSLDR